MICRLCLIVLMMQNSLTATYFPHIGDNRASQLLTGINENDKLS